MLVCFSSSSLLQASYAAIKSERMYSDRIPLTAYVLIALYETKDVSEVMHKKNVCVCVCGCVCVCVCVLYVGCVWAEGDNSL